PSNPPEWVRAIPPAFAPEQIGELGRIDAVLLTHEHSDHADRVALRAIATGSDAPVYGPASVLTVAEESGVPAERRLMADRDEAFPVGDLRITPVATLDPLAEGC